MKKVLAGIAALGVLAALSFGQSRPPGRTQSAKPVVSFNVGVIPLGFEEDETYFIGTFTLRADLWEGRSVTFAPELGVLTNFSAILLAPGLSINAWIKNFNLGAGVCFIWAGEGGAFVPKFNAGYRIGRVVLNVHLYTLFAGAGIWGASVGYVF